MRDREREERAEKRRINGERVNMCGGKVLSVCMKVKGGFSH